MWRTAALIEGAWEQSEPIVIEGTPPSLVQVLGTVRTAMTDAVNLRNHLEEEESVASTGKFVGSHDAIARWSALAEAEAGEYKDDTPGGLEALEEALAYFGETPTDGPPDTLAWHDHTTAIFRIPPGARHVTIDYTPGQQDENRLLRYKDRTTAEHELETILDARGYHGPHSAVIDYWSSMRRQGWGFRTSLAGISGYVIARVLRRLVRRQPTLTKDPTFETRLVRMSELYPAVADSCLDLSRIPDVRAHDDAVVFVHGTVSSGIQGLKDLCPNGVFLHPVYRFEHDTFLPIYENGTKLAELIQRSLRARRLLVAGHSRGGLVARIAVAQLRREQYPGEVYLQTFGTPHEGTPLADVGGQFLNLSYKLGCEVIGSVPALFPAVAAYSYVINCPTLPEGIDVMRQSSRDLNLLNAVMDPIHTRCWGSRFDIANGPSGFGAFVTGGLSGVMSGIDHDLVVPTASALAFGTTEPLLNCSHVNYFSQPAVQNAISAITPAVQAAAVAAVPVAADTDYTASIGHDVVVGPPVSFDPKKVKARSIEGGSKASD